MSWRSIDFLVLITLLRLMLYRTAFADVMRCLMSISVPPSADYGKVSTGKCQTVIFRLNLKKAISEKIEVHNKNLKRGLKKKKNCAVSHYLASKIIFNEFICSFFHQYIIVYVYSYWYFFCRFVISLKLLKL